MKTIYMDFGGEGYSTKKVKNPRRCCCGSLKQITLFIIKMSRKIVDILVKSFFFSIQSQITKKIF